MGHAVRVSGLPPADGEVHGHPRPGQALALVRAPVPAPVHAPARVAGQTRRRHARASPGRPRPGQAPALVHGPVHGPAPAPVHAAGRTRRRPVRARPAFRPGTARVPRHDPAEPGRSALAADRPHPRRFCLADQRPPRRDVPDPSAAQLTSLPPAETASAPRCAVASPTQDRSGRARVVPSLRLGWPAVRSARCWASSASPWPSLPCCGPSDPRLPVWIDPRPSVRGTRPAVRQPVPASAPVPRYHLAAPLLVRIEAADRCRSQGCRASIGQAVGEGVCVPHSHQHSRAPGRQGAPGRSLHRIRCDPDGTDAK